MHPLKGQASDYAKFLELHKKKSGTEHFRASLTKTKKQKPQRSEEEKRILDLVGGNIKVAREEVRLNNPEVTARKKLSENHEEFPLMNPKEIDTIGGVSNVALYMRLHNQEVETKKNVVDQKMEQQIKSSKTSLMTPGLVINTGKEDQYKTIDDGFSDKLNNASAKAGKRTTANIVIPNEKEQIDIAKALQVPDKNSKLFFLPEGVEIGGVSNVGGLMRIHANEITSSGDKKHAASDSKVEKVAKQLREAGGNNWVPVLVKQTGEDSYEVVGNHFAYDVAKKANISRIRAVVVK